MLHGFPGDNPFGLLVRGHELVLEFGEPFAIMDEYAFGGNDAVGEFHSKKEDMVARIMNGTWQLRATCATMVMNFGTLKVWQLRGRIKK